jgi:serine/threonine protein kinase
MTEKTKPLGNVGPYILGKTIGQGSTGKVKFATKGNKQYCCKIVRKPIPDKRPEYVEYFEYMDREFSCKNRKASSAELDDERLVREIAITLILDHPYIVSLHEVYATNTHYYLFMDVFCI